MTCKEEMDSVFRVQILGEAVGILPSVNKLRKAMKVFIYPADIGRLWDRFGSLTLSKQLI